MSSTSSPSCSVNTFFCSLYSSSALRRFGKSCLNTSAANFRVIDFATVRPKFLVMTAALATNGITITLKVARFQINTSSNNLIRWRHTRQRSWVTETHCWLGWLMQRIRSCSDFLNRITFPFLGIGQSQYSSSMLDTIRPVYDILSSPSVNT